MTNEQVTNLISIIFADSHDPFDCRVEVWASAYGHESLYLVSNLGRVMRIASGPGTRIKPGGLFRIKNTPSDAKGYPLVNLWKKGNRTTIRVHRLSLLSFVGGPPEDKYGLFQVHHKDGKTTNNRLDNLEWITAKENREEEWNRYVSGRAQAY
jgi:hypothetical protein